MMAGMGNIGEGSVAKGRAMYEGLTEGCATNGNLTWKLRA